MRLILNAGSFGGRISAGSPTARAGHRSRKFYTTVAAGLLVQPLSLSVPGRKAFYLVYLKERLVEPRVCTFREWILSEGEPAGRENRAP